ncbi:MAG: helix-turn-helix transcriptional regulator [Acutalibacteraceae bacterium]|nr:helix-turn-helix transcriptional regulator [Acutalibacteraceae bacterium]
MKPRKKELGNINIIGANVTKLRKLHKMTQKELAINMQLLGVDINFSSLSKLEGQTRIATDKEVYVIAQVFGIKTNDLFKNI